MATGGRLVRPGPAHFPELSTDSRKLPPGCLFVALPGESFDGHAFVNEACQKGAGGAVVEQGRSFQASGSFAVFETRSSLAALGALARHHRRRFQIPVAAVTGSNGKTTAKEMVGAILAVRGPALKTEGNLNNEVGVPLTLMRLGAEHRSAVVEMGMSHPGEIARLAAIAEPRVGLVTNAQPAHLAGLGSVEEVARAKGELYHALPHGGTAVANMDDPRVLEQAKASGRTLLTFGRAEGAEVRLIAVDRHDTSGLLFRLAHAGREHPVRLGFVGEHNALNGCAAFAVAVALGFSPEEAVRGLEGAKPYGRRLNLLPAPAGYTILDDCYNANPSSMRAALETLAELSRGARALVALGDMLELGEAEEAEHRRLGELAASRAAFVGALGPRAQLSAETARKLMPEGRAAHFDDPEALAAWLKNQLRPGDLLLVKGSRGMRMERVIDCLLGKTAEQGGAH